MVNHNQLSKASQTQTISSVSIFAPELLRSTTMNPDFTFQEVIGFEDS